MVIFVGTDRPAQHDTNIGIKRVEFSPVVVAGIDFLNRKIHLLQQNKKTTRIFKSDMMDD
jgi:hypothetical protein